MGITVTVEDLIVETCPKRGPSKTLLKNVWLSASPGEMVAIMGPSGSGKTTLLNVLSNRLTNLSYTGSIAFNGRTDLVKQVNRFSCYVMQEDCFLQYLTVIETLTYAARLMLSHLSKEDQRQRVQFCLDQLGLECCRDVAIGGERVKGISGGQKKRVSIAVALLNRPALIFLDEPTSGLDAALAYDVIKTVEKLCHEFGHTIICTIHQPRSQVFSLFDSLVLLRLGEVCYRGPAKGALTWFESIGHPCPPEFNPPDFFLDLLTTSGVDSNAADPPGAQKRNSRFNDVFQAAEWNANAGGLYIPDTEPVGTNLTEAQEKSEFPHSQMGYAKQGSAVRIVISEEAADIAVAKFGESEIAANQRREIQALKIDSAADEIPEVERDPRNPLYRNLRAAVILADRDLKNDIRNPKSLWTNVGEGLLVGLVTGTIWYMVAKPTVGDDCQTTVLRNMCGGILQLVGFISFGSFHAAIEAVQKRPLVNREASSGLYHRSTRFLSTMMSDVTPQYFSPVFCIIFVYWMMGLAANANSFICAFAIAWSLKWAAMSLAAFAGYLAPIEPIAAAILPVLLVNMLLTSGFQLSDNQIPAFLGWYKHLSFLRFAFQGIARTQFTEDQSYLDRCLGFETSHEPWMAVLNCFLVGLGFRVFALVFCTTLHKSQGLSV